MSNEKLERAVRDLEDGNGCTMDSVLDGLSVPQALDAIRQMEELNLAHQSGDPGVNSLYFGGSLGRFTVIRQNDCAFFPDQVFYEAYVEPTTGKLTSSYCGMLPPRSNERLKGSVSGRLPGCK